MKQYSVSQNYRRAMRRAAIRGAIEGLGIAVFMAVGAAGVFMLFSAAWR